MAQYGWDENEQEQHKEATPTRDEQRKPSSSDQKSLVASELVIDPALKDPADKRPSEQPPFAMDRRRHYDDRLPSPPLVPPSHSPSPSLASGDRSSSSISTPPVRRSPPSLSFSSYHHDPSIRHHHPHPDSHFQPRADMHPAYLYAPPPPPPPFDHRYQDHHHHPYHTASGLPTHFAAVPAMAHPSSYGSHAPAPYPQPGQPPVTIIHTDDAATKLSDRVRRRCFNCCTTDTSTWRRSNLSPGKVLCNKCGLFERTHSRPRPEQFPHKRGPLATTSLQRRTPPANQQGGGGQQQQQQQPPGGPAQGYPPPPPQLPPIAPGYPYSHPSIPPLGPDHRRDSHHALPPNGLPGLASWHGGPPPPPPSGGGGPNGSTEGGSPAGSRRSDNANGSATGSPAIGSRLPTPPPSLSRSVNTSQDSGVRDGDKRDD